MTGKTITRVDLSDAVVRKVGLSRYESTHLSPPLTALNKCRYSAFCLACVRLTFLVRVILRTNLPMGP